MTYNIVDEQHGVVQVEGEVMEIEGVKCGVQDHSTEVVPETKSSPGKYIYKPCEITELKTGALIASGWNRDRTLKEARSRIRSVEFGPAMVRTKTTLERMGISYPVNKV